MDVIEIGPQPEQTSEVPDSSPEFSEDPNVTYVRRAMAALALVQNHPMSTHETRILKDALVTIFGPALIEAEKALKSETGGNVGEGA